MFGFSFYLWFFFIVLQLYSSKPMLTASRTLTINQIKYLLKL